MTKKPFSEEDRLFVLELLRQGHALSFIAKELGREASCVRRWATRIALVRSRRPWTEADKRQALKLRARGASSGEIAEALERSAGSISSFFTGVRRAELRTKCAPPSPPVPAAPPAPRDLYVQWVIAQEYIRRKNSLTPKNDVL